MKFKRGYELNKNITWCSSPGFLSTQKANYQTLTKKVFSLSFYDDKKSKNNNT